MLREVTNLALESCAKIQYEHNLERYAELQRRANKRFDLDRFNTCPKFWPYNVIARLVKKPTLVKKMPSGVPVMQWHANAIAGKLFLGNPLRRKTTSKASRNVFRIVTATQG